MMPMAFLASLKYSRGLTLTSAPVVQFSWHEYAGVFAPAGLSGVFAHRLHFTASRSAVSVTSGGSFGIARLSQLSIRPRNPLPFVFAGFRGTIEIALYGHCVS